MLSPPLEEPCFGIHFDSDVPSPFFSFSVAHSLRFVLDSAVRPDPPSATIVMAFSAGGIN